MGDVMSLAVILYTGCAVYTVSSPNTDYFAMVLVGYIISKWFRCRFIFAQTVSETLW